MSDPINSVKITLTDAQKSVLKQLQKDAVKNGKLDSAKASAIIKENKDLFVGDNGIIDTESETEFFRAILDGNIEGGDEFKPLGQALKDNIGKLSNLFQPPDASVDKMISDQKPADPSAYVRDDAKDELNADGVKNIQNARNAWRSQNVGNSFSVSTSEGLNEAESAAGVHGSFSGLSEGQTKIRSMLKTFWNNDPKGIKFLSIKEMNAIRAWGEKNYSDKESFYKDFKEMFLLSVKEDTPFSMDLMARQWTEIMGSSTFMGKGSTGFKDFFGNLGTGIASDIINTKGLKEGDIIASFNGKSENPAFDNVLLKVGKGNIPLIQISKSQYGDSKKIGYVFDGSIIGSGNATQNNSAGGMGSAAGSAPVGTTAPVDKKTLSKSINKLKEDLDAPKLSGNFETPNLDRFTNIDGMSNDDIKSLINELSSIKGNEWIDVPTQGLINSILGDLNKILNETPSVPGAPPLSGPELPPPPTNPSAPPVPPTSPEGSSGPAMPPPPPTESTSQPAPPVPPEEPSSTTGKKTSESDESLSSINTSLINFRGLHLDEYSINLFPQLKNLRLNGIKQMSNKDIESLRIELNRLRPNYVEATQKKIDLWMRGLENYVKERKETPYEEPPSKALPNKSTDASDLKSGDPFTSKNKNTKFNGTA